MNEVRIIGGQFRGRRIHFKPVAGLRPTLDSVRETLFNWLMFKVKDARCLDLFAGSGALGLEALSRFAAEVVFVDSQRDTLRTLKKNIALLELHQQARVIQDTALHFLTKEKLKFDLIFLDPPFHGHFLQDALNIIYEKKILSENGLIYFEAERKLDINTLIIRKYNIYRHKFLGEVQFGLLDLSGSLESVIIS